MTRSVGLPTDELVELYQAADGCELGEGWIFPVWDFAPLSGTITGEPWGAVDWYLEWASYGDLWPVEMFPVSLEPGVDTVYSSRKRKTLRVRRGFSRSTYPHMRSSPTASRISSIGSQLGSRTAPTGLWKAKSKSDRCGTPTEQAPNRQNCQLYFRQVGAVLTSGKTAIWP